MKFDFKRFFRYSSLTKILSILMVLQSGAALKRVEAQYFYYNPSPYIRFELGSGAFLTSSNEGTEISLSFVNRQTWRVGNTDYPHPIHNINFTITPVTLPEGAKSYQEARVAGGLTFLDSPTCKGADPFSVLCPHSGAIAYGGGTVAFRAKVDFDQYSINEYVSRTGTVLLRVNMTYNISNASGSPASAVAYLSVPVSLVKPAVPTPIVILPTPTPFAKLPTATPIAVVPPSTIPITPDSIAPDPLIPEPSSLPRCGNDTSQQVCDCLECRDTDVFRSKEVVAKRFEDAAAVVNNAIKRYAKYVNAKRSSIVVRSTTRAIKNLREDLAELFKEMGDSNFTCDDEKYCQDISSEVPDDIEHLLHKMKAEAIEITRSLRKFRNSAKDIRIIRNAALVAQGEGLEALEDLPTVTSVCTQTDAAVVCK